jgi:hypothetical protein
MRNQDLRQDDAATEVAEAVRKILANRRRTRR